MSLDELPEAVANAVAVGLTYRWAELRALEMVGDELADEYELEDAFEHTLRQSLSQARAKVLRYGRRRSRSL